LTSFRRQSVSPSKWSYVGRHEKQLSSMLLRDEQHGECFPSLNFICSSFCWSPRHHLKQTHHWLNNHFCTIFCVK
jgi:hypothetical protein